MGKINFVICLEVRVYLFYKFTAFSYTYSYATSMNVAGHFLKFYFLLLA